MKKLLSFLMALCLFSPNLFAIQCEKNKITLDVSPHIHSDLDPRLLRQNIVQHENLIPFDMTFTNRSKKPVQFNPAQLQPYVLSLVEAKKELTWTYKKSLKTTAWAAVDFLIACLSDHRHHVHYYGESRFFDYTGTWKGLGIGLGAVLGTVGGTASAFVGTAVASEGNVPLCIGSLFTAPFIYLNTLHLLTITLNSKYFNEFKPCYFGEPLVVQPGQQLSRVCLIKAKEVEKMKQSMVPLSINGETLDHKVAADFKVFWGPNLSIV